MKEGDRFISDGFVYEVTRVLRENEYEVKVIGEVSNRKDKDG